jgi:hypothetical protein
MAESASTASGTRSHTRTIGRISIGKFKFDQLLGIKQEYPARRLKRFMLQRNIDLRNCGDGNP